jgi:hypothetical protein
MVRERKGKRKEEGRMRQRNRGKKEAKMTKVRKTMSNEIRN